MFSYFYLGIFSIFCLFVLDVYVTEYFITSFLPLLLWVWKKYLRDKKIIFPLAAAIIAGVFMGIADQFRHHSATGLIITLILFLLFAAGAEFKYKLLFIGLMLLFMPLCNIYFSGKISQRNTWLKENTGMKDFGNLSNHAFWHSLYTGLGFADNKYGITWSDFNSFDKAKQLNPALDISGYNISPEYEATLRGEYLSILKNDPLFVMKTYARKFIYILLFIFLFFNYGFVLLRKVKPSWKIILLLIPGITFHLLPGILVYPLPMYMLAAFNLLVMYEMFLLNEFLDRHKFENPAS